MAEDLCGIANTKWEEIPLLAADLAYAKCRRRRLRSVVGTTALKWKRKATMMLTTGWVCLSCCEEEEEADGCRVVGGIQMREKRG